MSRASPPGPGSAGVSLESLDPALLVELRQIVGEDGVITEPGRLLTWESDALTRFRQLPRAVVLPRDTEQVARTVRLLVRAGVPLTPRGAGTGLSGGGVAVAGGVLVGTSRMNRILEIDATTRLARVQAGVVNADLSRAAAPMGLHYAPDPSSQTACTLGGNVGENAGGPHCLKYGVTTRYVTGLTVVTGTGEVVELGGAHRCEGLDLVGLFVGSEGRLGLATEIELRLVPRPRAVRTLLAAFSSTEDAGAAVSAIIAAGLLPAAMEMMDRESIRAVEASVYAAGYPTDAGAVLVVEFDGTEAGLDAEAEAAEALCRDAGASELRRARTEEERQALWQGRKKAYGAFGRVTPDLMVQDATVPRSALPAVLARIGEIGERHGLHVANVFHAGDGNLHPKLLFDRRDPGMVERVERASKEMMQVCVEAGGTITGEHGVGLDKRDYMHLVHGPEELETLRAVQRVFDPTGIWNPGKVIPDPSEDDDAVRAAVATSGTGTRRSGRGRIAEGTVVRPGSAGEVAELLARASRQRLRVRVRGRDSADGAEGCLTVVTEGLPRTVEHAPADLTVTVGAGCTLRDLQETLARSGQWLPLDIPGSGAWPLGEVVARGEWGPLAPAFGRIRDLLLGAELVTGDGRRLHLGGRVMKNVAGFDLVRGTVGSRGRWGVLTSLTFRLMPLPRAHAVLSWDGTTDASAAAVRGFAEHPILPAALVRVVEGGMGRVHLRLLGSEATVSAESKELSSRVPDASLWAGTPSGPGFIEADPVSGALAWPVDSTVTPADDVHEGAPENSSHEPGTGGDGLLEVRPGGWDPVALEARIGEALPEATVVWQLPLARVWRIPLGSRSRAPASILAGLRRELRENGGDLCMLRGRCGEELEERDSAARHLADRVSSVFDPAGVLGARIPDREPQ